MASIRPTLDARALEILDGMRQGLPVIPCLINSLQKRPGLRQVVFLIFAGAAPKLSLDIRRGSHVG